jgi:hypothetical protein
MDDIPVVDSVELLWIGKLGRETTNSWKVNFTLPDGKKSYWMISDQPDELAVWTTFRAEWVNPIFNNYKQGLVLDDYLMEDSG